MTEPAKNQPKSNRDSHKVPKGLPGIRPVAATHPISVEYGVRGDWAAGFHTGIDYACPVGTIVRMPRRAKVTFVGWNDKYGRDYGLHVVAEIEGVEMLFAHLSRERVRVGQVVPRGHMLGRSGDSGRTFGAHLHFETRHAPYRYGDDCFNPHILLAAGWVRRHVG